MANKALAIIHGATVMQDPVNRQTNTNTTMLNMKVSVQTTKKAPEGSNYPYVTDIYDVVAIGKTAENLIGKVKAKTKIYVDGELMMGEPWTDRSGVTHINPKIYANHIEIESGGNWGNGNKATQAAKNNEEDAPF